MKHKLTASPADSKNYHVPKSSGHPPAAKSNREGVSTPPAAAKRYPTSTGQKCEPAAKSSGSGQDKAMKHSVKANTSNRRG